MARDIPDLALLLSVQAGFDARLPLTPPQRAAQGLDRPAAARLQGPAHRLAGGPGRAPAHRARPAGDLPARRCGISRPSAARWKRPCRPSTSSACGAPGSTCAASAWPGPTPPCTATRSRMPCSSPRPSGKSSAAWRCRPWRSMTRRVCARPGTKPCAACSTATTFWCCPPPRSSRSMRRWTGRMPWAAARWTPTTAGCRPWCPATMAGLPALAAPAGFGPQGPACRAADHRPGAGRSGRAADRPCL